MSLEALPDELIVEMILRVPRAYGTLYGLVRRFRDALRPHVEWAKTASCVKVVGGNVVGREVYWILPNGMRHGKFIQYHTICTLKPGRVFLTCDDMEQHISSCIEREVDYVDGVKHGLETCYTMAGRVIYSMYWRNGKKHGKFIGYYQSGDIVFTIDYIDGHKHGREICYHETGDKKYEIEFEHGVQRNYRAYPPDT
ncbi:toxin-antitoxin system YwqK [Faustovirus]|nr:toxin-antitoxin system YwqK [Faustovirus]